MNQLTPQDMGYTEHLGKIYPLCQIRDFIQVSAELEVLSKQVTGLVASCIGIEENLRKLVRSVREMS